jgi:sigma-70 region 2
MALIDDEKDKKAFEKLYNKYKNKVHAISLNILKNEQLAEESTSDTFYRWLNVFKKLNI